MNMKKAILATMIVSSVLVAVAGPIPAGAEAAQEQKQTDNKKIQIDQKLAAKLQKAIKVYTGEEIKLKKVGEKIELSPSAKVESVDGKYAIRFNIEGGKIWGIDEKVTIEKISKEDQGVILKVLKKAYENKSYAFNKEVIMHRGYDGEKEKLGVNLSYTLTGKDFDVSFLKENSTKELTGTVGGFKIRFTKEELDPKLLETAAKATKTAFNHDFEVTDAKLINGFRWILEDKDALIEIERGELTNVFHKTRKAVTTNKKMTEKEAKDVVAPLAKELFNMDITGLEVKWGSSFENYYFIKDKKPVLRAALDADKNVVSIIAGVGALYGF
ncbi:hypothetical protein [Paenibacillus sp. B1-33]|uniref:hypothetical protein n=1 Tax=unclassified Paenibacillus TaxID=185978 RepID=UPI003D2D83C0